MSSAPRRAVAARDAGYAAYVTLISGYMLGSLWCYAAIFAAALEANLAPSGHVLYVGLFAVVVPLPEGPRGPKAVQALLAFGRVVIIAVMLSDTAYWVMGPIAPMPERTGPSTASPR